MNLEQIPFGWLVLGLVGQGMFSTRFLIQWIASERRKQSVVPIAFWWFSLAGGLCLLSYATFRADPIFILGQSAGMIVYLRNLVLLRRNRLAENSGGAGLTG
jgi:lipid-A-disaccharide synthase-like uncharacterized protein